MRGREVAAAKRKLHLVDSESGEVIDQCPNCAELDRELRRQRTVIANLRADKEAEAKRHEFWDEAVALWVEWKIATDRSKCRWSADRFWLCEPYLRNDGWHVCRFAVWGIAANPNEKRITATYSETYNDWELLFRNRGTFERYSNRGAAIFGRALPQDQPVVRLKDVVHGA